MKGIRSLFRPSLLVSALGALLPASALSDEAPRPFDRNWAQWRGPRGTGFAPYGDPPREWSESKNVAWKVSVPGSGHSTPIVWQGRIFLTTAVKTEEMVESGRVEAAERAVPEWRRLSGIAPRWVMKFSVYAYDLRTGGVLWSKTLRKSAPHEGLHADSTWASASAVTDGEVLIAHFGSNGTYALDLDGNPLWDVDLGDMRTRKGFGEGSSPVIYGDRVFVNWDHEGPSFATLLDKKSGKEIWRVDRDEVTSWSTPVVLEVGGKPQVVISATGKSRGYDLATGNVVWESGGMTVNSVPTPLSDGSRVFVMSGYRGSMLQAIDLSSARGDLGESPAVLWSYGRDTSYVPSGLLYDGLLYFMKQNGNILTCLDAEDGEVEYRRVRIEKLSGVYASLVGAANKVYVLGRDGNTAVLRHGRKFELLAVNSLDDRFDASPVIVGKNLLLRGHKSLYLIREK